MAPKKEYSYEDKIGFVKNLYCAARQVADETGCSWQLILSQAAQETGWGEHVLAGTNNIFNIKADSSWSGESKVFTVWEKVGGEKVWVKAPFRVYGTVLDSLRDRQKFLASNPRYTKAGLFGAEVKGDLYKEATALQHAGYATDERYAAKLKEVYDGKTMQRAIAAARKEGCKGCLPTINVNILDAARVPLANARIRASQGSNTRVLVTDNAGRVQIQAALSGGQILIEVWSEHDSKWIAIEEKITPASPPAAVTLVGPTLVIVSSTEHHEPAVGTSSAATAVSAAPRSPVAGASIGEPHSAHVTQEHYTIRKGDSLSRIAKAHSTSYLTLARLNGIASPYYVYPGQILKVPKAKGTARSSPAAAPSSSHSTADRHRPSSSAVTTPASPGERHSDAPPARPENAVHTVRSRNTSDNPQTDVLSARRAPWMAVAEQEFLAGVRRRGGANPDQHIEEYFTATSLGRQHSDNLAYCAAFVNWCLTRAGYHGNNSAGAASLGNWGRSTKDNKPAYGAVAVVRFSNGGHHVTFVNGRAPSHPHNPLIAILGGNQGNHHEVSHSHVPASWITHYRFPIDYVESDEDYELALTETDNATMTAASTH